MARVRHDGGLGAALAAVAGAGAQVWVEVPWPGERGLTLAALVVGPSGVWVVEHRAWPEVTVRDGRVLRARDDVSAELRPVATLAHQLAGDLARLGLVPGQVHAVLALAGRGGRLGAVGTVHVVGERELAAVVREPGARLSAAQVQALAARVREITGEGGERVAAGRSDPLVDPLVDPALPPWATYLDPAQAAAAWRPSPGPLRISGAPGTGTSVVAVHRAVHLARTHGSRVALVAPTAPLVARLQAMVRVLGPEVADAVVVLRPVELARRVLAGQGVEPPVVDPVAVAAARDAAELGVLTATPRGRARLWDEVVALRGRGRLDRAAFDALRPDLVAPLRQDVWALSGSYAGELGRRGVSDEHDIVRQALDVVGGRRPGQVGSTGFDVVIVDDAQDLSLEALRLVRAVAGDGPNALTLLDDGLPGLLPGGPSLPEAGIEVTAVALRTSYRLSVASWAYTVRLLTCDGDLDLGGLPARPRVTAGLAEGPDPQYVRSAIGRLRRAKLVEHLLGLLAAGAHPGRIGVLHLDADPEPELGEDLVQAGVPTTGLDDPSQGAVRLGPARQARGLELDHVLVPDAPHRLVQDDLREDNGEQVRTRRLLALAVTRSRGSVWIGGV